MADEVIRSKSNPLVRRLRELVRGDRASGVMLVEGVRLVEEALRAGVILVEAAVASDFGEQERGQQILERLAERDVPMRRLHRDVLASLSDVESSQGILLIARLPEANVDKMTAGKHALVLILSGVQNPGNVGGLIRAGEAAGATGAFLGDGTADPLSPKALRGAMGSAFRLPLVGSTTLAAVDRLRKAGLTVWAATTRGQRYDAVDWTRPSALVVGNEGAGLAPEIVHACSGRVSVPMGGQVESLNVAVAGGIILFEAARQRRAR